MINKNEDISFITDENGKEIPIQVLEEFTREENGKRFVIYSDIADSKDEETERQFLVAEIITLDDGSMELAEVDDESDMAYCQKVFDSIVEEMLSHSMGDEDFDDEDDFEEDTIVN
ncbi:DUF1292 domain-containing protein [bacterium]|nr:DUF1292 domain-containing protein [bacterium]